MKDSFVLREFNIWVRNDWLNSVFNPSILIREDLRLRKKKKRKEEEKKADWTSGRSPGLDGNTAGRLFGCFVS